MYMQIFGCPTNHILQVLEFNGNISILVQMLLIIINTPL